MAIIKNRETNVATESQLVPDYMNDFFANISYRVCNPNNTRLLLPGERNNSLFLFTPPEQYEIFMTY